MSIAKILVVEDEAIVAVDLKSRLTRMGHCVVGIANKGSQAVALAEELRPDLVLMDVRLRGEMDGIQAAAQIRSQFGTRIIFLTALIDVETLKRADAIQPSGYINKPFDTDILKTTLEKALGGLG